MYDNFLSSSHKEFLLKETFVFHALCLHVRYLLISPPFTEFATGQLLQPSQGDCSKCKTLHFVMSQKKNINKFGDKRFWLEQLHTLTMAQMYSGQPCVISQCFTLNTVSLLWLKQLPGGKFSRRSRHQIGQIPYMETQQTLKYHCLFQLKMFMRDRQKSCLIFSLALLEHNQIGQVPQIQLQ